MPTGGTAGQVLEKIDGTDYNTQWATPSGGGGGGTFSGSIANQQIAVGSGTDAIGGSGNFTFASPNVLTITTVSSDIPQINMAKDTAALTMQVETSSMLRLTDGTGDGTGSGSGIHLDSRTYATTPAVPTKQLSLRAEHTGSNQAILTLRNANGYVRIGPQNSSFCHFYTDRAYYYFNKPIQFDGGQFFAYNDDLQIKTDDSGSGQPTRIFVDAQVDECRVGVGNGFSASSLPTHELHVRGEVRVDSLSLGGPTSQGGAVMVDRDGIMSVARTLQDVAYQAAGVSQTEPYTDLGGNFASPPASIQEAIERIATQLEMILGGPIP